MFVNNVRCNKDFLVVRIGAGVVSGSVGVGWYEDWSQDNESDEHHHNCDGDADEKP